jgi:hypothetical protein
VDEVITIASGAGVDPDGAQLRGVLDARLAYERARAIRRRWLSGLALTAASAWLAAPAWPAVAATAGTLVMLRTAVAAAMERRWYRRWTDAVADHPGASVLRQG